MGIYVCMSKGLVVKIRSGHQLATGSNYGQTYYVLGCRLGLDVKDFAQVPKICMILCMPWFKCCNINARTSKSSRCIASSIHNPKGHACYGTLPTRDPFTGGRYGLSPNRSSFRLKTILEKRQRAPFSTSRDTGGHSCILLRGTESCWTISITGARER